MSPGECRLVAAVVMAVVSAAAAATIVRPDISPAVVSVRSSEAFDVPGESN
jgi:hypothetical protein